MDLVYNAKVSFFGLKIELGLILELEAHNSNWRNVIILNKLSKIKLFFLTLFVMSSKLFWFDKPLFRNEEPLRYTGYNEYRSSGAEPRMSGVNYSRYTEPIHRYSRYSEPTPRYSRYSDPTTPDDRSYCRTTVSWDGATRVTQKSCF